MFFRHLQRTVETVLSFLRNQSGSIMIYTGAFMAIGVGGAALSIDIGRIVLLKTQMQNRADAGALAGAAQLDARLDAIWRAETVVHDAMQAYTTAGADQGELITWAAFFYEVDPLDLTRTQRGDPTTDDGLARFVEVIMDRRTLSFFYGPALNLMTGNGADSSVTLDARAVGMSDPFVCKMQPLFICDPFDDGDAGTVDPDITDDAYVGYGLRIKQGPQPGAWGPGNFGLLELPEDAGYGVGGANAVEAALAAEDPLGCYAVSAIETQTGVIADKVADGVNTRWYADGPVAPNVMNYLRDNNMNPDHMDYDVSDPSFGSGTWDIGTYWSENHMNALPMPPELVGATRYQVYLFEQGVPYCKKNGKKNTKFAVDCSTITGGGWSEVSIAEVQAAHPGLYDNLTPSGVVFSATEPDNNYKDGEPPAGETVSAQGHKRRLMKIAVAKCEENSFNGSSTLPADGVYLELFLTEEAETPPDMAIYGEIVGALTPNTSLEFHGNVRLVE
jgi:hypothetical protein